MKLTSDKMAFSTRSFEGMIYYLGEAVRYQEIRAPIPSASPACWAAIRRWRGNGYFETMFYSSSHLPDDDAAVTVRDDAGKTFACPNPACRPSARPGGRPVACSAEYPDNESLQVLNFVNQVWGLQKESVQGPTSPLVVVSPQ